MRFFGASETGLKRKSNQDAFFASELDCGAFAAAVCDGMGGAAAGNIASTTASKALLARLSSGLSEDGLDGFDFYSLLKNGINDAEEEIGKLVEGNPDYAGMGTTAVAVICAQGKAYLANIGDSRCYKFSSGVLTRLTKDHSYVQLLVDNGSITEDEAEHHPNKNIITRSLGGSKDVISEPDFFSTDTDGSKLLLCSDGLTNYVSEQYIAKVLSSGSDVTAAVGALIDEAIKNGGGDNVTAVCADFTV